MAFDKTAMPILVKGKYTSTKLIFCHNVEFILSWPVKKPS